MTNVYEKKKIQQGFNLVCGCDEVGRGCLAGPVIAAAVVLDPARLNDRVNRFRWFHSVDDSKRLSSTQREELDGVIKKYALGWAIGMVNPKGIDKINIHHASLEAMRRAVHSLLGQVKNQSGGIKNNLKSHLGKQLSYSDRDVQMFVVIDGKFILPKFDMKQEAVVDGDAKILSIAAASIVAKVYRDNLMRLLDKKYPGYQFAQHKGYATKVHREAIQRYGLSDVHRSSFCGRYL